MNIKHFGVCPQMEGGLIQNTEKKKGEENVKPHMPMLSHNDRRTNLGKLLCAATVIRLLSSAHYAVNGGFMKLK